MKSIRLLAAALAASVIMAAPAFAGPDAPAPADSLIKSNSTFLSGCAEYP